MLAWNTFKEIRYDILAETQNAMNTQQEMINKYNGDAIRYSYMLSPSKFLQKNLLLHLI